MVAARAGNRAWVDALLAHGAAVAARTTAGEVALDAALACAIDASPWGPGVVRDCHGDVARALLAGAKPPLGRADAHERSTLARAIMSGDDALVARLLALGVRDASVDHCGANPYHYAARYGSPAMVTALAAAKLGGAAALGARRRRPDAAGDCAHDRQARRRRRAGGRRRAASRRAQKYRRRPSPPSPSI